MLVGIKLMLYALGTWSLKDCKTKAYTDIAIT